MTSIDKLLFQMKCIPSIQHFFTPTYGQFFVDSKGRTIFVGTLIPTPIGVEGNLYIVGVDKSGELSISDSKTKLDAWELEYAIVAESPEKALELLGIEAEKYGRTSS